MDEEIQHKYFMLRRNLAEAFYLYDCEMLDALPGDFANLRTAQRRSYGMAADTVLYSYYGKEYREFLDLFFKESE